MPEERLHKLIRTFYAVGGGALALSMAIFLRSESLELGPDLVAVLQVSWALLFYVVLAAATVQFCALFRAPSEAPGRPIRVLATTGFVALVAGLVLLGYVSLVALADANAEDNAPQVDTRTV